MRQWEVYWYLHFMAKQFEGIISFQWVKPGFLLSETFALIAVFLWHSLLIQFTFLEALFTYGNFCGYQKRKFYFFYRNVWDCLFLAKLCKTNSELMVPPEWSIFGSSTSAYLLSPSVLHSGITVGQQSILFFSNLGSWELSSVIQESYSQTQPLHTLCFSHLLK